MKEFFHRFFTQDAIRKISAIILGVLLFITIHKLLDDEKYEDIWISNVPVEIQVEPSLMVSQRNNHQVRLHVHAPKEQAPSLRAGDFSGTVQVREKDLVNGKCEISLFPKNFTAPPKVKILQIDEKFRSLRLNVQRKVSEAVRPIPVYSGKLSDEFRSSVTFAPEMVLASGPEIMVRGVEIKTEGIPLNESITGSFDYVVSLVPPPGITVEPIKVRATVMVEPRYATKTLEQIPVLLLQEKALSKNEISFAPGHVNVTLKGPLSLLAGCNANSVRVFIDLTGIRKPGVYALEPQCKILTSGVTFSDVSPAEIRVKVK